jgi:Dockerin type I domain
VASASVNSGTIIQAAATYGTALGTYVVFRGSSSAPRTFRINAANPPTITTTWSVTGQSGRSSPFVTSTDGTNNAIVWVVGSGGDNRLHGYNGDTGAVVYAGGGPNELMTGTRGYNANAIAARGRIYVAADNKVYAFNVPVPALQLTSTVSRKTHGAAGDFDIDLPLTGEPGVECRSSGGNHTLVITFSNPMVSGNASVTSGTGTVAGSPAFSGNTMTVNLTGVADVQQITVTLSNVTDTFSQILPDTAVSMNMLIGDTNANKSVNSADIAQTKGQSGLPATAANFRTDVNVSGAISAADIAQVKANSGHTLP